jgi:glycosyltransferase involved in cell wall biosynthesis
MAFCACNSLEQLIQSTISLSNHPTFKNKQFCPPGNVLLHQVARVCTKIYPDKLSTETQRVRRRVVSFFLKRLTTFYHSINRDALDDADIFHSTFFPLPAYIYRSSALQRFITIYDMIPVLFPEYFETQITKNFTEIIRSIRTDDWVIAISQSTKNDFCDRMGFDPSRVFVTPLAASELFYRCNDSMQHIQVRRRYRIPDGAYALSLCTFEPRKNIDHTIRCFVRTVREQRIPDLNLVLVGTKGWDFDRIFSEITSDPEMQSRIIVTGYVPDQDLASLYSNAMMFVYPSLYEGFGLPLLEAMQCGVPVISSNTSSLPEVVGDAGLMVPPTDGDALCQAMLNLYKNSNLRAQMALKSLERSRRFSWEKCARETLVAYKTALQS